MAAPQIIYATIPEAPPPLPPFSISAFWEALNVGNIAKLDELSQHPDFIDLNLAQPNLDPTDQPEVPLHHVIEWYNESKVPMDGSLKWLLDHGADPNLRSRNEQGCTSIHGIVWNIRKFDQVKVAEMLVKYGADVTLKMGDGSTALHDAVKNGALELVNFLLKNGARSEEDDGDGYNACSIPFYDKGMDGRPIPDRVKNGIRGACGKVYFIGNDLEYRRRIIK